MAITRTAMIDDDGSGTTGTILNNAWKQELYNQIDGVPVTVGYAPIWGATGGAPALGNGTLVGTYVRLGNLVLVTITLTIGSTTTLGGGAWTLSLPPLGALVVNPVLTVEVFNSAAGAYPGIATIFSGVSLALYAAGAPTGIGPATPFVFKAGDRLLLSGSAFYA